MHRPTRWTTGPENARFGFLEREELRQAAQREQERNAREMAAAQRLQQAMFPAPDARLAGVSLAVRHRACASLGGDLADYATAGDNRVALLITDVCGHGVSAAMLTTVVKSAFHAAAGADYDPRQVVRAAAAGLRPFGPERFVTLLALRLDRASQTIEYVNAGHLAGWVYRAGQIIVQLDPTGPLVSPVLETEQWEARRVPLPANAGILLYTDGLPEAVGDGGRFTTARISDAVARHRGGGAALVDGLLASLDAFTAAHPLADDVTVLTATVGLPGLA